MLEVELYIYRLEERHGNRTAPHAEGADGVNNGSSQPLYVNKTPQYRLDSCVDARLPQRSKLKDPD